MTLETRITALAQAIGADIKALQAGGGGGATAWADITGKPQLLGPDGWFYMVAPGKWSALDSVGGPDFDTLSGTLDVPNPSSAGLRLSLPRWNVVSGTAANTALEQAASPSRAWRGNAVGRGGFVYRTRFSVTSTTAKQRGFFGLQDYAANYGGAQNPYLLSNSLGIAFDSNVDANYQITHNASGAATKVNAGSSFPLGDPSAVLDLTLSCAPNASTVAWKLLNLNSGASASGTLSTNLPSNTAFLSPRVYMNNGGTAAAVQCDVMMIYVASCPA